ncbi:MAG: hypothetical protein CM15mP59_2700 [Flavobacteriaceae bacterium]|nr:MAG: hypothetical protein CM15mP59_2700 [Flavobacteriaceae bacterium]
MSTIETHRTILISIPTPTHNLILCSKYSWQFFFLNDNNLTIPDGATGFINYVLSDGSQLIEKTPHTSDVMRIEEEESA